MKNENVKMSRDGSPSCPYTEFGARVCYKEGFPDRGVKSPREVLTNLTCKLRRLLVFIEAWLSSWSYGHVAGGADMVLLCRPMATL
jgi:hypothetical protein